MGNNFIHRLVIAIALLATFGAGMSPVFGAESPTAFFSGVDDLPLMVGLTEDTNKGVVFDTPAGRIVEAYARGRLTPDSVRAFYVETLPQLGWRVEQAGQFRRDSEELELEIVSAGTPADGILVRFALSPAAPAGK